MLLVRCIEHLKLWWDDDCNFKIVGHNQDSVAILVVDDNLASGEISDELMTWRMRCDGNDGRFWKCMLNKAFGIVVCFFLVQSV